MSQLLIIASTILGLIGPVFYIASILKGKTKPHRTTRFVLLLIVLLGMLSLHSLNDITFWPFVAYVITNAFIFILSLKRGMGGFAITDILCLIVAIAGLIIWQVSDNPVIALYSSIVADLMAMIPAIIKTYKYPHTELWLFYFLDVIGTACILIAHQTFTFNEIIYPTYLLVVNTIMTFLIFRPRFRKN